MCGHCRYRGGMHIHAVRHADRHVDTERRDTFVNALSRRSSATGHPSAVTWRIRRCVLALRPGVGEEGVDSEPEPFDRFAIQDRDGGRLVVVVVEFRDRLEERSRWR